MILNTILLALKGLRRNMLRSFLTILGVVIGVSTVVTMVTLGNGTTQSGRWRQYGRFWKPRNGPEPRLRCQ